MPAQGETGAPSASGGHLGPLVDVGRTADIHTYGRNLVVKLFRAGVPRADVDDELVRSRIASDSDFPAPRNHGEVEVDGRRGILFDRIDGPSMLQAMQNPRILRHAPATLADLQRRMHQVRAPELPDVREMVLSLVDRLPAGCCLRNWQDVIASHLRALPAGDQLLHLDFHPGNVMLAGQQQSVIDWSVAARGDPAADVAVTAMLLAEVELSPGTSALARRAAFIVRPWLKRRYVAAYLECSGMTRSAVDRFRLLALIYRRVRWDIPSESAHLEREIERGCLHSGVLEPSR